MSRASLPPGPGTSPPAQTMAMTGDAYGFLRRCALEHGDTFTLRLEGWDPLVVFSHPEGLREVFAAHPDDLHVGTAEAFLAAIVGGEGSLFTVDGASHLDRRRGLTPAFAPGRTSLHGRLVAQAIRSATRSWPPPQPVAIHQAMEEVSRQVMVRALLGLDPGDPRLARSCELVGELVRAMVAVVGWEEVSRDPSEVTAELDAIVFDEIAARRGGRRSAGGSDVLQILIDRRGADSAMSDQEVRDLLLTLIVAGTDTTGSAMAWALLLLARHPAARDRLLAEIDGLGREPDPEALAALPYAHAVACEVLRVRPVTPLAFTRRVERPIRLGGVDLEPGDHVSPCIYLAHHRAETWPEPDSFRPERFLERRFSPQEFLPFGGGVRRCIGMALALVEMKVALGMLLARFELAAVASAPPTPLKRGLVISPSDDRMLVTSRSSAGRPG